MSKSELGSFDESPLHEHHILDDTRQRDLPKIDCLSEWLFSLATRYSRDTREVDPWLRGLYPTSNIEIHIVTLKIDTRELAHHRDEEIELALLDPTSRPLGIAELGIGSECLDLDEDGTIPFDSKCQRRT